MGLWKTFPASTWVVTDNIVSPVGLGLKPYGLAYAVDDSKFLNGFIDAEFEIIGDLFSVGIAYRANLAWTLMGCVFSNYDVVGKKVIRNRLTARILYVRNGILQTLKTLVLDEFLNETNVRISLAVEGAAVEATLVSGKHSSQIDGNFPHLPFAGSAGVLSLHRGNFRCINLTSSVSRGDKQRFRNVEQKVFLCHASQDKDQVRMFAKALALRGIEYWLDEERIGPGDPVAGSIAEGLELCTHIIPFLSSNLKMTNWARAEYNNILNLYISNRSKKIIPVFQDRIAIENVPILMADLRRINIANSTEFEELVGTLTKKDQIIR